MLKSGDWFRDLLVLTLLLGSFFGFELGERALWSPDEGRYSEVAREMVVTGDYITPRLDGIKFFEKPPLFYWLQSASIKAFGLNEWSLRLWPAMFALLGCLAVYAGGRKLFGRRTALLASVVLATSGLYYAMSRVADLDTGLSTLLTCALISFLLGTREPPGLKRRSAMWAFFVFAALAVLEKGLIGIVIPSLVIGTWILVVGESNVLKNLYLPSGLVLFLTIAAPWHVLVAKINPEFLDFYFIREHFQRFLYKNGPLDHPWTFVPVLFIGLFPWTVFLYQAIRYSLFPSWRPRHGHKEAIFLALWAGWVFLFFSLSSSKVIPYILPMFPPLAILIGRYFSGAWNHPQLPGLRGGCLCLLCAALVLVLLGVKGPQHYLERYSNWPDLEVPMDEATIPSTSLNFYPDLMKLSPYMIAQSAILLSGALATSFLGKRNIPAAFSALGLTAAFFLVVLNSSLPIFDQRRSVKDLALTIKPWLQPNDEVASYHAYYQDLPLYLQRHVTQVGWVEPFELWEEELNKRADDDKAFWQKWNSPQSIYALTDRATYAKLRAQADRKLYLVAQNAYDVVFSNRKDTLATDHESSAVN
jgi:Dolichyl-phosphate-mannose-protein mannosyltransferase/Aminoarabinose transferase C-terminal domain